MITKSKIALKVVLNFSYVKSLADVLTVYINFHSILRYFLTFELVILDVSMINERDIMEKVGDAKIQKERKYLHMVIASVIFVEAVCRACMQNRKKNQLSGDEI